MKWFRRLLVVLVIALGTIAVTVFAIQKLADGPIGPVPGALFTSGTEVDGPVNWSTIIGFNDQLEFQLLSTE